VAGGLGIAIMVAAGLSASAATPTLADPSGDAKYNAPGYMDIVGAEAVLTGDTISFRMSVAAAIPATPPLPPPGNNQIHWDFPIDSDPSTFPAGYLYPSAPGQSRNAEFFIKVAWDGSSFSAVLVDRRPLLSGGEATFTPLAFTISGTDVQVAVPASLLPSSFSWGALTIYWSSTPGTAGIHIVDNVEPFYTPFPA
jgi:hypothetical protein